MKKYLMTPGPVEISDAVARVQSSPMIGHRGSQFSTLFSRIEESLCKLFDTSSRSVIIPASGTGALECLAANFVAPGDKVLSISCGVFGDRFREITARYGGVVTAVDVPLGEAVTPEIAAKAVADNPDCKILLLTHNETSTGVVNPLEKIIAAIRGEKSLILVDGVSSIGAMPCYPERWGIDGLATASQKGLLTPPGLGLVWLSERAWKTLDASDSVCPSYYFDLKLQRKELDKAMPQNPYTPPVSLFYALEVALAEIESAGFETWFAARERAARSLAAGLEVLGFDMLVKDDGARSPGVTACSPKNGDADAVRKALSAMGVSVAEGQAKLKGKIIRIAHYGDFNWPEIAMTLGSLYAAMGDARNEAGDSIAAAYNKWIEGESVGCQTN